MKMLYLLILSLMLNACVGLGVVTSTSETEEHILEQSMEWVASANKWREDQLAISKDKDVVVWSYESKDWCGALVVIIPLMLPVCDSTDTYYFKENMLIKREIKKAEMSGFFCSVYPVCETGDDCSLCIAN